MSNSQRKFYRVSLNKEDSDKLEEFMKQKGITNFPELVRKLIKSPARPFPPTKQEKD
jgi:hypothetical protein